MSTEIPIYQLYNEITAVIVYFLPYPHTEKKNRISDWKSKLFKIDYQNKNKKITFSSQKKC